MVKQRLVATGVDFSSVAIENAKKGKVNNDVSIYLLTDIFVLCPVFLGVGFWNDNPCGRFLPPVGMTIAGCERKRGSRLWQASPAITYSLFPLIETGSLKGFIFHIFSQ